VAVSRGDGTFDPPIVTTRAESAFGGALAITAARAVAKSQPAPWDLLWTGTSGADRVVAATVFGGASPVDRAPQTLATPAGGWAYLGGPYVGDLTGDATDDLVFAGGNEFAVFTNDGTGLFTGQAPLTVQMTCGQGDCPYDEGFRVADVDGDGKADLLRFDHSYWSVHSCDFYLFGCWSWTNGYNGATQALLGDPSSPSGLRATPTQGSWPVMAVPPDLVDVSGDGRADLVWIVAGSNLTVSVATARTTSAGAFTGFQSVPDHGPSPATPPGGAADWTAFRVLYGDVNGDGKTDVIFTDNNAVGSILVDLR